MKKMLVAYTLATLMVLVVGCGMATAASLDTDNSADWYFPGWAATAKYNTPITVKDTDSALGRYSQKNKSFGMKDIVRFHGHLCDGMVIAYVEIKDVLGKLFPDGVVDRTDLRVVTKNGPCWVDTAAYMTGGRINFQTMRVDNSIGDGFIVQRISTGEAYDVHLKPGVFPADQAAFEGAIRKARASNQPVSAADIDKVEAMGDALSKKLLTTPPADLLVIKKLENYRFVPLDLMGNRGDVINKDMPR